MPTTSRDRPRPRLSSYVTCLLAVLAPGTFSPAYSQGQGREVRDFYNPIITRGADPWIVRGEDGFYYLCSSEGRRLVLTRSRRLTTLGGGARKVVWTAPADGPYSRDLWAPELHRFDGRWYIYVAADDGENANHRMYALENPAADPFEGEFTMKGRLAVEPDRWAIDGTAFESAGSRYFIWSGWEGTEDVSQELYIARMRDPWTLEGPRVRISKPDFPWEVRGGPPSVNEGPEVVIRNETINLVYSASGSWTDHYNLGLLTAKVGADLMDPSSWTKRLEPIFQGAGGAIAPGHGSFTKSPDGTQEWFVYHTARYPGSGWDRQVFAQEFTWNPDDTPNLGMPVGPDTPLPFPSGEPPRICHEAELAELTGLEVHERKGASGERFVQFEAGSSGKLVETIKAPTGGRHVLAIRAAAGPAGRRPARLSLQVGDGPSRPVAIPKAGLDRWTVVYLPLDLEAGPTRLVLTGSDGPIAVDRLELVPEPSSP